LSHPQKSKHEIEIMQWAEFVVISFLGSSHERYENLRTGNSHKTTWKETKKA
jgi:hypothetical protein